MASADLDDDGDLDVVVAGSAAPLVLEIMQCSTDRRGWWGRHRTPAVGARIRAGRGDPDAEREVACGLTSPTVTIGELATGCDRGDHRGDVAMAARRSPMSAEPRV
jgi:hypothetical protein